MEVVILRKAVVASIVAATLLTLGGGGNAFAHRQTVSPPGQEAPVIDNDPISNSWAQAHCNANAPSVVAGASNGVVVFSPQGELPCPPAPNPGGQVHPGTE